MKRSLLRELHFNEGTTGGSRVELHYLRDKEKHEVDFLSVIDNTPVMIIEVKSGDAGLFQRLWIANND